MNVGDLNKVWEVKALKRKPRAEDAQKILEKVAKQVQPIMIKHKWRVKLLSEFCPKNARLLGLNVGGGVHVKLRLRRANREEEFIPFHEVLDTMLHELCHNVHGPHNASFYNLWDEIRKECEDLISKGISGTSQGFDLPGRRLGGFSRQPPLTSLRQTALAAAEKRVRLGSMMPSGSKRLGGDTSMMAALSPIQAAAMAAERRLQDNIWCGSETYDECEEREEYNGQKPLEDGSGKSRQDSGLDAQAPSFSSQKRRHDSSKVPPLCSHNGQPGSNFVDLTTSDQENSYILHYQDASKKRICQEDNLSHSLASGCCSNSNSVDLNVEAPNCGDGSVSVSSRLNEKHAMWECGTCTLLNPPLAPLCKLCNTQRPVDANGGQESWSCKFCTLENPVRMDRCSACGEWRYSHGPPVATFAPNRGT